MEVQRDVELGWGESLALDESNLLELLTLQAGSESMVRALRRGRQVHVAEVGGNYAFLKIGVIS